MKNNVPIRVDEKQDELGLVDWLKNHADVSVTLLKASEYDLMVRMSWHGEVLDQTLHFDTFGLVDICVLPKLFEMMYEKLRKDEAREERRAREAMYGR